METIGFKGLLVSQVVTSDPDPNNLIEWLPVSQSKPQVAIEIICLETCRGDGNSLTGHLTCLETGSHGNSLTGLLTVFMPEVAINISCSGPCLSRIFQTQEGGWARVE